MEDEEDTLGHDLGALNIEETLKFMVLGCNHIHNVTTILSHRDKPS